MARRSHGFDDRLVPGLVVLRSRWTTEADIVRYANVLVVFDEGLWQAVELFDCSHGERNDRHRYDRDGWKQPPETFHLGTPAEGYRTSMRLIRDDFEGMIERWRW